jgi:hypothetical protein
MLPFEIKVTPILALHSGTHMKLQKCIYMAYFDN